MEYSEFKRREFSYAVSFFFIKEMKGLHVLVCHGPSQGKKRCFILPKCDSRIAGTTY